MDPPKELLAQRLCAQMIVACPGHSLYYYSLTSATPPPPPSFHPSACMVQHVAIKLEEVQKQHPQLHYESRVYKILAGGEGIPRVRWYGIEGEFNVMVMDLLGPR